MSAAQLLLRRLLDQAGGASETGYVLVIDGEGLESLPDQMPTPKGAYGLVETIHSVACDIVTSCLIEDRVAASVVDR